MINNFQISNFNFQIKNLTIKYIKKLSPIPYPLFPAGGFSLIELLVVIAVIAIIMVVVYPNFVGIRQRARDSARKSDLSHLQKSLELYRLDRNPPVYPTTGAFGASMCSTCWSSGVNCSGNTYIRKFPCDPGSLTGTPYLYRLDLVDNLKYTVTACLENAADSDRDLTPEPTCAAKNLGSYTVGEP